MTDNDEWMAHSDNIVSATKWIEESIVEEADAHHSRDERTAWAFDKTTAATTGGGRLATGKFRREFRKLLRRFGTQTK